RSFTGTGGSWFGASLTPDGMLVTTRRTPTTGVNVFSLTVGQVSTFETPEVAFPADVSVFADGTLAVSDQSTSGLAGKVELYTSSGSHVGTISLPLSTGQKDPFGSTVAPDNTLWVADQLGHRICHFSEDGALLDNLTFG